MARNLKLTDKVTIASSGSTSTALTLQGTIPLAMQMPSAFTGTAITFQCSSDGSAYYDLYNGSTLYSVTVAASRYIALNPDVFEAVRFIRLVSGSSEAAIREIFVISGER